MKKQFSEQEIKDLQKKFSLTYQVNYLIQADRMENFEGKKILEVGGSLPEELVCDVIGAGQWFGIESEDYWKSTQQLRAGIGSARRLVDIPEWPAERRHEIFLGQMEDLPERLGGYFDIAFSMACFEHIHHLGLALEKMYAALRPGGRLLSMFSPIWSAYDGHHLPQILDEEGRDIRKSILPHIPPWGHLLLSPPDMYHHLKREGLSSELASRAVYAIYYHPQINRLKTEDYARYIALSPFKIVQLIGTYPTQMTPEMTSALKQKYPGYTNFSNNGILALLEKPL